MLNPYARIKQDWIGFWKLPTDSRILFLETLLLLPLISISLRLFGFRRVYKFLSKRTSSCIDFQEKASGNDEDLDRRVSKIVDIVVKAVWRSVYPVNCLPRSLALWWQLQCHGIDADLRVGVRKQEHELIAHAWVELQDEVLLDTPHVRNLYKQINFPT